MISRRSFVAAAASALLSPAAPKAAGKPNIVIIVADDLGWRDISCHGGDIRTPNIDGLFRQGVELDRFYVAPVCSPTRAGLLTGRYPIRYGLMRAVLPPWRSGGLDTREVTIADMLARAGYTHRGIFGKWHLGHSSVRYHPLRRGFTEFIGHYNGAVDYFTHEREGELDWHRNYEPNYDKGYSTDLIGAAAAGFIQKHAANGPFFCYVPFNAPHSPFQAKPEHLKLYEGLDPVPGQWEGRPEQRRKARQVLGAMTHSLDENIGRILEAIQRSGAADNTLVLFFSDNGGVAGIGHNAPLNGAKASVLEGGIRVPAAIRWPAAIPGGRKITAPLAYVDVLPTLMRIVEVSDHKGKPLDGVDAFDILTGKRTNIDRDIYSYIGQSGEDNEEICYMTPEWKLVVMGRNVNDDTADDSKRRKLLFRINVDPFEQHNLAADHPDIVNRMFEKVKAFRALQLAGGVAPYDEGREGFRPPKAWALPDAGRLPRDQF